MNGQANTK